MGFVSDLFGGDSAEASEDAAEIQAQYQREALDYLKEVEALPRQYREAALTQLGAVYGLKGTPAEQQAAMSRLEQSPYYKAVMSGRAAGEESILRNASATGGLRSGNTQEALVDYNAQLKNQAIMQSIGGLQGFAGQPTNANQIASLTSGIGNTYAQGIIGGAQAQQAGLGMGINTGLGIANLIWSDQRLKSDIEFVGERNGHNWYRWTWNEAANAIGLSGTGEGVIAGEVEIYRPDAVSVRLGYKCVDYSALGV